MKVLGIDHVAIPVRDLAESIAFYTRVLGATPAGPAYERDGQIAVQQIRIGGAVLSLHRENNGLDLVARHAKTGSLDVCFRWEGDLDEIVRLLQDHALPLEEGPVARRTAQGRPSRSVYTRDPDGNLLEFMVEDAVAAARPD